MPNPEAFFLHEPSNHPTQALFAKAGFLPSGTIHNLDPNDPEIVYYKAVKPGGSGTNRS